MSSYFAILDYSLNLADMKLDQDFVNVFNLFVKRYVVWWFYGLALIEIAALLLRRYGVHVQLVSQAAREVAFKGLPTLAYFMTGMAVHWFVTWETTPWQGIWAGIFGLTFWVVGITYLLADIFDPNYLYWPTAVQWLRYPPIVALVGGLLAFVCFPQNSVWYPGRT